MNPSSFRHVLAEGNYLRLVTSDGWDYAERVQASGAVVIVAVTGEGHLLLTEQYRVPVAARVIELPAGIAGDEPHTRSEPLVAAARRELLEETGFEAADLIELTQGPPSAGLSSEVVTLFRATGLERVHQGGGVHHEAIHVHAIPLDDVPAWLDGKRREGLLIDPKVYAGLYFARGLSSRNDATL